MKGAENTNVSESWGKNPILYEFSKILSCIHACIHVRTCTCHRLDQDDGQ